MICKAENAQYAYVVDSSTPSLLDHARHLQEWIEGHPEPIGCSGAYHMMCDCSASGTTILRQGYHFMFWFFKRETADEFVREFGVDWGGIVRGWDNETRKEFAVERTDMKADRLLTPAEFRERFGGQWGKTEPFGKDYFAHKTFWTAGQDFSGLTDPVCEVDLTPFEEALADYAGRFGRFEVIEVRGKPVEPCDLELPRRDSQPIDTAKYYSGNDLPKPRPPAPLRLVLLRYPDSDRTMMLWVRLDQIRYPAYAILGFDDVEKLIGRRAEHRADTFLAGAGRD